LKRYTMDQGRYDWVLVTNQPIAIGPIAKTINILHYSLAHDAYSQSLQRI
jgi:hypothetical protein